MVWFEKPEQEQAYKRWLQEHPEGFVLNHPKGSKSTGNIAHRARCETLDRAVRGTVDGNLIKDYLKFCSLDYKDIATALERKRPGARFRPCKVCKPVSDDSDRVARDWWVSHRKSHKRELGGGYIWCPQVLDGDTQRSSWLNVAEVLPGDRIFSYANQKIQAVGIAQTAAYDAVPPSDGHNSWSGMGWKVNVAWRLLEEPFSPREHIDAIRPLLPDVNSPLQENGKGNLVYLVAISVDMAGMLLDLAGGENVALQDDLERQQIDASAPNETVRLALHRARVGQGLFRSQVGSIEKACRLTGVRDPGFLIASHIKPWRTSSNSERLDGHNGLLLAPHVDRLFDRGDISFADDGSLLVRDEGTAEIMKAWGLPVSGSFGPFSERQRSYLAYHREHLFATRPSPAD